MRFSNIDEFYDWQDSHATRPTYCRLSDGEAVALIKAMCNGNGCDPRVEGLRVPVDAEGETVQTVQPDTEQKGDNT